MDINAFTDKLKILHEVGYFNSQILSRILFVDKYYANLTRWNPQYNKH